MALIAPLRHVLESSELTFEEVRAFETGLLHLTTAEQTEFVHALKEEPELIYPLYINFKAKLRAANGTEREWKCAVCGTVHTPSKPERKEPCQSEA